MKKGFNILLVVFVIGIALSCNKTKSYTDRLKDERKMIDRLMDSQGFDVLSDFPKDSIFKENEFVKLSNGMYINVAYKGNGNKATAYTTNVLMRANVIVLSESGEYDTLNLYKNYEQPIEFKYGYSAATYDYYSLFGAGLNTPLDFLSDSCIVSVVLPFALGNSNRTYTTLYFEKAKYIFEY